MFILDKDEVQLILIQLLKLIKLLNGMALQHFQIYMVL